MGSGVDECHVSGLCPDWVAMCPTSPLLAGLEMTGGWASLWT
jgi:hypothetical protein